MLELSALSSKFRVLRWQRLDAGRVFVKAALLGLLWLAFLLAVQLLVGFLSGEILLVGLGQASRCLFNVRWGGA